MFLLHSKGYSQRAIARVLGRSVCTISNELKRNEVARSYTPAKAHHKAYARRKEAKFQGMRIAQNKELEQFIHDHLLKQQSPAAIAGRLATGVDGLPFASRDTIERYIRSVHGRKLEYQLKVLKRTNKQRRKKRPPLQSLGTRKGIDERPDVIQNRGRVGDLEADFIVSGKSGSGYLLTAADRKIRTGFIRRILPVTVSNMEQAFLSVKQVFPELASVTTDNDLLFQHHERLEQMLGVPIYFCDAYASWQKGTIENYNKHIRKYIPKGADISQYNDEYIQFVQGRLNSRFMSVIGYKTPAECLSEHRLRDLKNKTSR